jgi:hypothetical protein
MDRVLEKEINPPTEADNCKQERRILLPNLAKLGVLLMVRVMSIFGAEGRSDFHLSLPVCSGVFVTKPEESDYLFISFIYGQITVFFSDLERE